MKLKLLHSVCRQEFLPSADGVETWDLAVNPLSVILLKLKPLNDTGTPTNMPGHLELAGAAVQIRVLYRGQSVFAMSGRDALALSWMRHGCVPRVANGDDVDNERKSLTIPIMLGRFAYDPLCCFPASRRGELTMEVQVDIAATGYDGLRVGCETVELLGAEPKEYERKAVINQTFAATGEQNFELPIGHDVRGVLLFGTTAFGGAAPAPSWGRLQMLLDNQQVGYAGIDWEVAQTLPMLMGRQPIWVEHEHQFEPVAGVQTLGLVDASESGWENYGFLDLDPTRDDTFSVETKGANSFLLRATVGTADACRVVPIERIAL